ncbi:MAG: hypothetical protein M9916_11015 [Crocinitomicaceae bacterium]|nr:hypothetical protein [Crocinitomicaceae bacterium]
MKYFALILLIAIGLVSCKKETKEVNFHFDYFGDEQGRYVMYDVQEITHLSDGSKNYTNYQLKTVIGDTVHDNSGRIGNKFFRYKRIDPMDEWQLKDVWFIIIADYKGELVEENQRVIKLVFAPTKNKSWNGNAFNTDDALEYTYNGIHEPFNVNGFQLDSTVKVMQEDISNLIQYRKKYEIYAKGIGLVKKHYQHLNINNFDITNVSSGKEIYYDMIGYGKE